MSLVRMTSAGLYCDAGKFHIDPCVPVARAVITHAHGDHLTRGCRQYLTAAAGRGVVGSRLGTTSRVDTLEYGATTTINGVELSFVPAGHVLGSAQVRIEHRGEVCVVTGDYRTTADVTCAPFEPVRCHTLITESTFAHASFRWPAVPGVIDQIHQWWRENQAAGKASFLYAYAFGKAQRLLAALDDACGPIYVHPQVRDINRHYEAANVVFPKYADLKDGTLKDEWSRALLLLPPSARWHQPCAFHGDFVTAFASGWMLLPNGPKQRRVSHGFVLSDHADYSEIWSTIQASGAQEVGVMHGYIDDFVKELRSHGFHSFPLHGPHHRTPPAVEIPKRSTERQGVLFETA